MGSLVGGLSVLVSDQQCVGSGRPSDLDGSGFEETIPERGAFEGSVKPRFASRVLRSGAACNFDPFGLAAP